jgi:hypothetical protein
VAYQQAAYGNVNRLLRRLRRATAAHKSDVSGLLRRGGIKRVSAAWRPAGVAAA